MCGINGIWGNNDNLKQRVVAMNHAMAHRGPDDEGVELIDNVCLGHRRLSIIDLSTDGHQPFTDSTGRYTIVYNGEVYNFKELKSNLDEFSFISETDTEVVLYAFIKWGPDCLKRLNGMFAFAIYDRKSKTMFLARDRVGIKPLYYYHDKNTFVFSSEIRSILSSDLIPRKLNTLALEDYLRYQTVQWPSTLVKDVKMLEPGSYIEVVNNELKVSRFWDLAQSTPDQQLGSSYEETCSDIKNLLFGAVERRMMSDVPLGAFLSGGIDSSVLVAIMSELNSKPISTFSVVFEEEAFSEKRYSDLIAKKYKTDHHPILLKPGDFLDDLPNALRAMDHPSGDGPNTYTVSRVTKEAGVSVALSGLGGDEVFAGYDIFKRAVKITNMKALNLMPRFARKGAGGVLKSINPGVASQKVSDVLALRRIDLEHFYPVSRKVLLDNQIQSILNSADDSTINSCVNVFNLMKPVKDEIPLLSQVTYMEVNTYMQNVLLRDTDQMSMASALEVRVPFLDHTLMEYVFRVRDKYKYPSIPKKLLIDAVGDILPHEIVYRKKMGFVFPWEQWMREELREFCEARLLSLGAREYFIESGINELWAKFLKHDKYVTWSRLWPIIVLENWMQEHGIE